MKRFFFFQINCREYYKGIVKLNEQVYKKYSVSDIKTVYTYDSVSGMVSLLNHLYFYLATDFLGKTVNSYEN